MSRIAHSLVLRGLGIGPDRTIDALKDTLEVDELEVVMVNNIWDFVDDILAGRSKLLLEAKKPPEGVH